MADVSNQFSNDKLNRYITNYATRNKIKVEHYYPTSRESKVKTLRVVVNDSILCVLKHSIFGYRLSPIREKDKNELLVLAQNKFKTDLDGVKKEIIDVIINNYEEGISSVIAKGNTMLFQTYIEDSSFSDLKRADMNYFDKRYDIMVKQNKLKKSNYVYGKCYMVCNSSSNKCIDEFKKMSTVRSQNSNLYYIRKLVPRFP